MSLSLILVFLSLSLQNEFEVLCELCDVVVFSFKLAGQREVKVRWIFESG